MRVICTKSPLPNLWKTVIPKPLYSVFSADISSSKVLQLMRGLSFGQRETLDHVKVESGKDISSPFINTSCLRHCEMALSLLRWLKNNISLIPYQYNTSSCMLSKRTRATPERGWNEIQILLDKIGFLWLMFLYWKHFRSPLAHAGLSEGFSLFSCGFLNFYDNDYKSLSTLQKLYLL